MTYFSSEELFTKCYDEANPRSVLIRQIWPKVHTSISWTQLEYVSYVVTKPGRDLYVATLIALLNAIECDPIFGQHIKFKSASGLHERQFRAASFETIIPEDATSSCNPRRALCWIKTSII